MNRFAAFLGLDGGADADRGQAQPLGRIVDHGAALGQQIAGELPRSQAAAVGFEYLHQVLADRGQWLDRLLPAVTEPVQVRGHLRLGQAGGAGDLQRRGPGRDRGGPAGDGRLPGHAGQVGLIRYQALDNRVDGQPG
jgi:hypothetical protein